jgi:hypothetical protein
VDGEKDNELGLLPLWQDEKEEVIVEIWVPVVGFDRYEVSDQGRVRNSKTGRVLKPGSLPSGHMQVALRRFGKNERRYIHRLVAMAFIENPENFPIVRHLDDVPSNNVIHNLAWGTYADNNADAYRNGRNMRGPKRRVRVLETGEVFSSISECARSIEANSGHVFGVLQGLRKRAKGLTFEYAD